MVKAILRDLIAKQHKCWTLGVHDARKGKPRLGYDAMYRAVAGTMPERSNEVHERMAHLLLNSYNDGYSSVYPTDQLIDPDIKPLNDR